MKYCTKCGAKLPEDAEFCTVCGEKVEKTETVEAEVVDEEKRNKSGISERNIVTSVILTILTCGIYGIYWMIKINDELLQLSDTEGSSGATVILLSIVTCGIYGIYWNYKMGSCVNKLKRGGSNDILFLVLGLIGFGIVNYIIAQDTINNELK